MDIRYAQLGVVLSELSGDSKPLRRGRLTVTPIVQGGEALGSIVSGTIGFKSYESHSYEISNGHIDGAEKVPYTVGAAKFSGSLLRLPVTIENNVAFKIELFDQYNRLMVTRHVLVLSIQGMYASEIAEQSSPVITGWLHSWPELDPASLQPIPPDDIQYLGQLIALFETALDNATANIHELVEETVTRRFYNWLRHSGWYRGSPLFFATLDPADHEVLLLHFPIYQLHPTDDNILIIPIGAYS